jgi:hypothetical protein
MTNFNIILLPKPRSPMWSVPLGLSGQLSVCIPHCSHACYMSRPSHSLWLDHPNIIWWRIWMIKFLIMQFSPFCYLLSLGSKYSRQDFVLRHPQSTFFISCKRPSKIKGKVVRVLLTQHQAIKAYWGSGSTALPIIELGTRWRWEVSLTPRLIYPQGKRPSYPLDRRSGGPQSLSGRGGEEKNSQLTLI